MQPAMTCGAQGVAVHASGAMQDDHQPESDWLMYAINKPPPQLIIGHPDHFKASEKRERETYKESKCFRAFSGTAPKGGSVRVEISQVKIRSVQFKTSRDVDLLANVGKRVRIAEDGFGVKATFSRRTVTSRPSQPVQVAGTLLDHGVGLDGQSCSCLIVGWPVSLSSLTLGGGRPL
ncbi:hypothetical protein IGI04_036092, partial [Brassica rapa subsp. trilocularis]